MTDKQIQWLRKNGYLSDLDYHFANFIGGCYDPNRPELWLAAALVAESARGGHICLDIACLAGSEWPPEADREMRITCPDLHAWTDILRASDTVGEPGERKPLILDHKGRLYLYRYWEYEKILIDEIKARAAHVRTEKEYDYRRARSTLDRLFPKSIGGEIDWQRTAAATALIKRFCILSGGPGTGKTTTVARILALLIAADPNNVNRIALSAPTGKAAVRLQDAIKKAKIDLACSDEIKSLLPEEASTIHRLLRPVRSSPYFYYTTGNLLPIDLLIVDEASMIDLPLMAKLMQALSRKAGIILLGDKDQLASVEAGAVLGDICGRDGKNRFSDSFRKSYERLTGEAVLPSTETARGLLMDDCIVYLEKSYRFTGNSGIGAVSGYINKGEGERGLAVLESGSYSDCTWRPVTSNRELSTSIRQSIAEGFQPYGEILSEIRDRAPTDEEAGRLLAAFDRFRILCAVKKGPFGVDAINNHAREILKKHGFIKPGQPWYVGRPILITRNDYTLGLFNGDIGIILRDQTKGDTLTAYFPSSDATIRKIPPIMLPQHETVFAMTIHKSQGSEFDRVLLVLPNADSPVLTRELLYTGVTRARKSVEIHGPGEVFQAAVKKTIQRSSGLEDALWT